ncbi:MAG: hypothetical protein IIC78_09310 [Chloroflexi bacterium]|nr:hypothetical protein [Chloroflexota bacterium]
MSIIILDGINEDFMENVHPGINTYFSRIRRNHGLEHATIHTLSERRPRTSIIGRSDSKGFFLYVDLPVEDIEDSVYTALKRLRNGEHELAIHPNCGTNLLTAGVLSGGAAFLSLQGSKNDQFIDRLNRFPTAIMGAIIGLLLAQPIGAKIQKHFTTMGDPGSMEILSVNKVPGARNKLYRILTTF